MKKRLIVGLSILCISIHAGPTCKQLYDNKNESVEQAKTRFICMNAKQIHNICVSKLTSNQLQAFQELAKELFHSEIATRGCESQANRIKYEIMYQKIGELNQLRSI